jgi:pterin-4a-carbinolamine dehydratase
MPGRSFVQRLRRPGGTACDETCYESLDPVAMAASMRNEASADPKIFRPHTLGAIREEISMKIFFTAVAAAMLVASAANAGSHNPALKNPAPATTQLAAKATTRSPSHRRKGALPRLATPMSANS